MQHMLINLFDELDSRRANFNMEDNNFLSYIMYFILFHRPIWQVPDLLSLHIEFFAGTRKNICEDHIVSESHMEAPDEKRPLLNHHGWPPQPQVIILHC
jgi:hypothetical protein